jgi:hypothetical protein
MVYNTCSTTASAVFIGSNATRTYRDALLYGPTTEDPFPLPSPTIPTTRMNSNSSPSTVAETTITVVTPPVSTSTVPADAKVVTNTPNTLMHCLKMMVHWVVLQMVCVHQICWTTPPPPTLTLDSVPHYETGTVTTVPTASTTVTTGTGIPTPVVKIMTELKQV